MKTALLEFVIHRHADCDVDLMLSVAILHFQLSTSPRFLHQSRSFGFEWVRWFVASLVRLFIDVSQGFMILPALLKF